MISQEIWLEWASGATRVTVALVVCFADVRTCRDLWEKD